MGIDDYSLGCPEAQPSMKPRTRIAWTGPEVIKLRALYPRASWPELETALPRHSRKSISSQATKFKISRADRHVDRRHPLITTLRAKRRELRRPMVEIAADADIDRATLHHNENKRGHQLPRGETLERWANALGLALALVPLETTNQRKDP